MSDAGHGAPLAPGLGRATWVLTARCEARVTALRAEILACQRRITLLSHAQRNKFLSFPESHIFGQPELRSFLGFAQMSQNAGFLVSYLNERPGNLAQALLARSSDRLFQYIIDCAIPAFFGYFSSQEHLERASEFYRRVGELMPPKSAIPVFLPLLHSALTFRFIECVLGRVLSALQIDVSSQPDNAGSYIPVHGSFLGRQIRASLPLLPAAILCLFGHLRRQGWPAAAICALFLDEFLVPAFASWLQGSATPGCAAVMLRVVDHMRGDDGEVGAILSALFGCRAMYGLPLVYRAFGHEFLEFHLSVRDVTVIADLLSACDLVPETVALHEIAVVPVERAFHRFSCQVFLRCKSEPDPSGSLFGGAVPDVDDLMASTVYEAELKKWLDVLHAGEDIVVAPILRREGRACLAAGLSFGQSYAKVVTRFGVSRMARAVYLGLVEASYARWSGQDTRASLDARFGSFAARDRDAADEFSKLVSSLGRSKAVLVDAVWRLAALDGATLANRFEGLLGVMRRFALVQGAEATAHLGSIELDPCLVQARVAHVVNVEVEVPSVHGGQHHAQGVLGLVGVRQAHLQRRREG